MRDILPELNGKDYIENLNQEYDIHFCKENEVEELVEFIDTYWRKNHIFVVSRELLDWQHFDSVNKRYNFVLARHRKSGEIHSLLGFVPSSQFDSSIREMEVWPCIWKSRDDVKVKGLGVSLYYYLKCQLPIDTISILGISEIALSIYKHWNFSTGKIEQYYYPNMEMEEVLSSNREFPKEVFMKDGWSLEELPLGKYLEIEDSAEIWTKINKYKSKNYFVGRYYNHPIYKYALYAVKHENQIDALIVARECGNGISNCLRVVDYVGELESLGHVMYSLKNLMMEKKYEYIDFIIVGKNSEELKKVGFINRNSNPETIIPNYFEPFEKKNVNLDYAFKTVNEDVEALFFKADADQDRPNMLREKP